MTTLILSTGIVIVSILGAEGANSSRGCAIVASITSRIWKRAVFACARASARISGVIPEILISICSAVIPSRVPATLKSISPKWSSSP